MSVSSRLLQKEKYFNVKKKLTNLKILFQSAHMATVRIDMAAKCVNAADVPQLTAKVIYFIIFHIFEKNFQLSSLGPRNQKGIVTQMTCPYGFQYNDSGCRICRCRKAAEMKNELIVPRQKFAGRDCEWSKGSSNYLFATKSYLIVF